MELWKAEGVDNRSILPHRIFAASYPLVWLNSQMLWRSKKRQCAETWGADDVPAIFFPYPAYLSPTKLLFVLVGDIIFTYSFPSTVR